MNNNPIAMLRRTLTAQAKRLLGTVTHVETESPYVAITFDDGPNPIFTPRVVDILAKHDAKATFFMLGELAKEHPDIVDLVAEAGHAIGNHSWNHLSFPLLSGQERRRQIRRCDNQISPYTTNLFRPPYGHQSMASRLDALILRHNVIAWNLDVWDWAKVDVEWMSECLIENTRAGTIILLHDSIYKANEDDPEYDRGHMISALDKFLAETSNKFQFVTIPKLLASGKPIRANWIRQAKS